MFGIRSEINWKKKQVDSKVTKQKNAINSKSDQKQMINIENNLSEQTENNNSPRSPLKLTPKLN